MQRSHSSAGWFFHLGGLSWSEGATIIRKFTLSLHVFWNDLSWCFSSHTLREKYAARCGLTVLCGELVLLALTECMRGQTRHKANKDIHTRTKITCVSVLTGISCHLATNVYWPDVHLCVYPVYPCIHYSCIHGFMYPCKCPCTRVFVYSFIRVSVRLFRCSILARLHRMLEGNLHMANHPVKDSDIKKIGLKNMSREKAAWKTWETLNWLISWSPPSRVTIKLAAGPLTPIPAN